MFNFIKKATPGGGAGGSGGSGGGASNSSSAPTNTTTTDKDDKEKRKRDKKDRKEKQKKDRASMSTEELLRLDEVRRSLKIRGRRKDKEKLPSGITADYTADFLASLTEKTPKYPQISSENLDKSLNSSVNTRLPPLPPKPPKRGILKTSKISIVCDDIQPDLLRDTSVTYQNLAPSSGVLTNNLNCQLHVLTSTSPSIDSLTDTTTTTTTNSSFATPPFSQSPIGESEGLQRWTRHTINDLLPIPPLMPMELPPVRTLVVKRQKLPRNDFGFSIRRGMIMDSYGDGGGGGGMKAVIFAEPGKILQYQNVTGLLPGDRLLAVNGVMVGDKSREDIIDMIKASGDSVTLMVQPVAELSELSRRSNLDGGTTVLDDTSIKMGTLKRSGSKRFDRTTMAKTDEHLEREKQWLKNEKLWLIHRAGFTLATKQSIATIDGATNDIHNDQHKITIKIDITNDILIVDDDDVEKANPPEFDFLEDVANLRYLNESSIIHTLRQRYGTNLIHTYAGNLNTLLIINPMQPLSIYSETIMGLFKGCKNEDMPPHIYSIAQSTLQTMLSTKMDQSIIFMGRSGSGKTTNLQHCLDYLLTTTTTITTNLLLLKKKLDAITMILNAFGNCETIINKNSTRFTKIFTINYDLSGQITTININCLLLESSRIIYGKYSNFKTFHIMSYLLNGADTVLKHELMLDGVSCDGKNRYFKFRSNDLKHMEFLKIKQSFKQLDITDNEQKLIFMILSAIYHLGGAGLNTTTTQRSQFMYPQMAQRASHLLGVTYEQLSHLLFDTDGGGGGNQMNGRGLHTTTNQIDMNVIEMLMIGLYNELFFLIQSLINRSLSITIHRKTSILLIDMPGFQNQATVDEKFQNDGENFANFCHNYMQERLQLLYYQTMIIEPQEHLMEQNVKIDHLNDTILTSAITNMVDLYDRAPSNNIMDKTDMGLLSLLNAESEKFDGNEDKLFNNIINNFKNQQYLLKFLKNGDNNKFILEHLYGTNPVLYNINGWLNDNKQYYYYNIANNLLQKSSRDDLSKLFINARTMNGSGYFGGSMVGMIDTGHNAIRHLSFSGKFSVGNSGLKYKSICLQMKLLIDQLILMIKLTNKKFVHCLLPQHDAGVRYMSDLNHVGNTVVMNDVGMTDMINIPLLRSQLRGIQLLDVLKLYKQGYPIFMNLNEFYRRFHVMLDLGENDGGQVGMNGMDEKNLVKIMMDHMDLDSSNYRIGSSQIFFRNGVLTRLETQRDERLNDMIINFQTFCRGYLARKYLIKRKLQDIAVRCIQRNVRKFLSVRDWQWWRLLVRVTPLLDVHRTEEELRKKTDELEALKIKLEKLECERTTLKHENDKLETKLSEITSDLAEEQSTSTITREHLNMEINERLRLEKLINDMEYKNKELKQSSERLEMELIYTRNDLNGDLNDDVDIDLDDDDGDCGAIYKKRYETVLRELEYTKRRLQQQHEDDLEQLVGLKKQLEKKLTDAYEEINEQQQLINQWKLKYKKLQSTQNDQQFILDKQIERNEKLEKKQRHFDTDLSNLEKTIKLMNEQKLQLQQNFELLQQEKLQCDTELNDNKLTIELKNFEITRLEKNLLEFENLQHTDDNLLKLHHEKIHHENMINEQNMDIDELLGQIGLLEQNKLKLEMLLESLRKEQKKDLQLYHEEIDNLKYSTQKKMKILEEQLEQEHGERLKLIKLKTQLDKRLIQLLDNEKNQQHIQQKTIEKYQTNQKLLKILIKDMKLQLNQQQTTNEQKSIIRKLRHQLDDLESSNHCLTKSKQTMELDMNEQQMALDVLKKQNGELEQKLQQLSHDNLDKQQKLDDRSDEYDDLLKKFHLLLQQTTNDKTYIQQQMALMTDIELERDQLKDDLMKLQTKYDLYDIQGVTKSNLLIKQQQLKIDDLELKLDYQQSMKLRLDIQLINLKNELDLNKTELVQLQTKEQQLNDDLRRMQRQLLEKNDDVIKMRMNEQELIDKRKFMDKHIECLECELIGVRNDLKLALKRIDDLQSVIQGDLIDVNISDFSDCSDHSDNSDDDDDDDDDEHGVISSSDEYVDTMPSIDKKLSDDGTTSSMA